MENTGTSTRAPRVFTDMLADTTTRVSDMLHVENLAVNVVDNTISSLINIGTLFQADVKSVVPKSFERYHRAKGTYDAMTAVPTLFLGGAGALKAARMAGKVAHATKAEGLGGRAAQLAFADVERVTSIDRMLESATRNTATAFALMGETAPGMQVNGALSAQQLAVSGLKAGSTFADARGAAQTLAITNAVKDAVGTEIALASLANTNEFLFPDEAGVFENMIFAGAGVGIGVQLERVSRRFATRKMYARASKAGAAALDEYNKTRNIEGLGGVAGTVGEQWQGLSSNFAKLRQLSAVRNDVDGLVSRSNGQIPREELLKRLNESEIALRQSVREDFVSMGVNSLPEPAMLRTRKNVAPAVSQKITVTPDMHEALVARETANPDAFLAASELTERGAAGRYAAHEEDLTELVNDFAVQVAAAEEMGAKGSKLAQLEAKLNAAQEELNNLGAYRAATLEADGTVNFDTNRQLSHNEVASTAVASDKLGFNLKSGRGRAADLTITPDGSLRLTSAGPASKAIAHTELDFYENTAMYALVGKISQDPKQYAKLIGDWHALGGDLDNMPIAVLDALDEVGVPTEGLNPVAAANLRAKISSGEVAQKALLKKLEAARAMQIGLADDLLDSSGMGLVDLGRALNLKLTDARGIPNALGHSFEALTLNRGLEAAELFNPALSFNEAFDNFIAAGVGQRSGLSAEELDAAITEAGKSLREGRGLADDRVGGVGVVYHNIRETTATEQQLAKIIEQRQAVRAEQLFNADHEMMRNIATVLAEDGIAYEGSRNVRAVFSDDPVGNNKLAQTPWAHRAQVVIQHAHAIGQRAERAMESYVVRRLKPVMQTMKDLHKSGQWAAVAPQLAEVHALVSRGFALGADATSYQVGRNIIDMSRPGSVRVMDSLGPLKNAPAKGEPWEMFSLTIARNEGRYVPLELSDQGADLLNQLADVSAEQLTMINALRKISGRKQITPLNGHLPTVNFTRFKMRYIQDFRTGKVVGYVKGRTDLDVEKALQQALDDMHAKEPQASYARITATQIQDHFDAVDDVYLHKLRDFSGMKQTGGSKGRNADFRLDVSTDLSEDMVVAMRKMYSDIKNRTVASVYADSIHEAGILRKKMGVGAESDGDRTFDPLRVWQNMLMASSATPEKAQAKLAHNWIETLADDAMGLLSDKGSRAMAVVSKLANGDKDLQGFATAEELKAAKKVLDAYRPLSHLAEDPRIASYLKISKDTDPYKLQKILQKGNRAVTTIALKFANVRHPILNAMGIASTLPSTVQHLLPMKGEAAAAWASRVGPNADYMDYDKLVATANPTHLLRNGLEAMLTDPDELRFAAEAGYLEANMMEELHKISEIAPSSFEEAMSALSYHADFVNRWLTPLTERVTGKKATADTLSERSESAVRAAAHMVGLEIAKLNPRLTRAERHAFAYRLANDNIADFAPNIRGQAFQGLAGVPFGLFQSYSINTMQRLFGYVENKEARTLAVQAFTQVGMFGTEALPGWPAANALYYNVGDADANKDGATNLNERLYAAYGKGASDLLMAGLPSNLPQLFGGEAVNLYTSGDMNPRLSATPPILSFGKQIYDGVTAVGRAVSEELPNALDSTVEADFSRIPAAVANYFPASGVRSGLQLMLGEQVDRQGNLRVADTRSGTELFARMIGTTTRNTVMEGRAVYDNSQATSQRIADMKRVRSQMLRHIRNGSMTDAALETYFKRYLDAGGSDKAWARWLDYTSDQATKTKAERKLDALVNKVGQVDGYKVPSTQRLLNSGVQLPE